MAYTRIINDRNAIIQCTKCGRRLKQYEFVAHICSVDLLKQSDSNVVNALLADVRADLLKELLNAFIDLLNESKCYYNLYPNSHRATVEEYFKIEDELIKKVSEHFR